MTVNDGADARDAALDAVLRRDWIWRAQVVAFIEALPQGWVGTGEDIRLASHSANASQEAEQHAAIDSGIPAPKHPNAWGAVIMYAVKNRKWLMWTGKVVPMRDKSSHARITRQYARWDKTD